MANTDPELIRIRGSICYKDFMKSYKFEHPICADPFNYHKKIGEIVPSSEVHHIIPLEKGGEIFVTEKSTPLKFLS